MTVKATKTEKVSTVNFNDFNVVIGVRVRITPEKKQEIKAAYDALAFGSQEQTTISQFGGIKVEHAPQTNPKLEKEMGCNRLVLSSLLGSNERHPVSMLMNWERVLGIQIVDRKEVQEAWKSYFDSNLK